MENKQNKGGGLNKSLKLIFGDRFKFCVNVKN